MARKAKKRSYSRSVGDDVAREMRRYKKGTARSGPGGRGGRVGAAEDIAWQILSFMANGFATGSIVYVDGGALVN